MNDMRKWINIVTESTNLNENDTFDDFTVDVTKWESKNHKDSHRVTSNLDPETWEMTESNVNWTWDDFRNLCNLPEALFGTEIADMICWDENGSNELMISGIADVEYHGEDNYTFHHVRVDVQFTEENIEKAEEIMSKTEIAKHWDDFNGPIIRKRQSRSISGGFGPPVSRGPSLPPMTNHQANVWRQDKMWAHGGPGQPGNPWR